MSDDGDRIEQIRSRRRKAYSGITSTDQQQQVRTKTSDVSKVSETKGTSDTVLGVNTQTPWLRDRVTLSLEAQIAMIEMRSSYKLSLADLGYHNRQQITNIKPGVYLKVEPTGCYKMSYHNRM
jgi:hypothetical protein